MSRDVNSEENGTLARAERRASWKQVKNFGCKLISKVKNYPKRILDPGKPDGHWISLMLCVISISIDPLLFYVPVLHLDGVCMEFDKRLGVIAFTLRSAVDLIYVIYVYFLRRTQASNNSTLCCRPFLQFISRVGFIDLLAVLPLPQVPIVIMVLEKDIKLYYSVTGILKAFVYLQFVPRVIRIYPLLKKATGTLHILAEVIWAKAAFNFYLYLLFGHVFGALWYYDAIELEIRCWRRVACETHRCDFGCHDLSSAAPFQDVIKKTCSADKFALYKDVLQNITGRKFAQKFMYCFRWGLQSLSCFAQNLEPSPATRENIFTVMITIVSLVLFVFLIGNMQLYIQSGTSKSEEMKLKMREIKKWKPYKNLPKKLQKQVMKHQLYVWRETKGADVDNFLNNLPKDLRRNIKGELCSKLLKKVPNFKSISQQRLNAMCERLKHVLYSEGTYIVRKNDPVDEMLFVIDGELLIDDSSDDNVKKLVKYQYDFYGDELSSWAQECPSSSKLPISMKNIKTRTEVQAFALTADDLKDVFTTFE